MKEENKQLFNHSQIGLLVSNCNHDDYVANYFNNTKNCAKCGCFIDNNSFGLKTEEYKYNPKLDFFLFTTKKKSNFE